FPKHDSDRDENLHHHHYRFHDCCWRDVRGESSKEHTDTNTDSGDSRCARQRAAARGSARWHALHQRTAAHLRLDEFRIELDRTGWADLCVQPEFEFGQLDFRGPGQPAFLYV